MDAPVDISRSAQIRDIEASFAVTDSFDLGALKHPNKPGVTAVDSYEIFPDAEIWANAYDLFRFSERPGERPSDVRILCSLSLVWGVLMLEVVGRGPATRLCYSAPHGVRWGSLFGLLPDEG